ncbi:aminotransferase class I/II-fold pyridoxal phosphate-dependent enzyme [Nocardia sp. 2]|uniref:Aminotransferase class I/II-fold pyridoxal phosphate-dependent enzyme n=1 Tax=Nocardia acididurans TaxID=2802282 RepID=A0ABS1MHZ5_9NOCA|nr:pyridoxal phosphate-dependent aminotransferase [Nocardia acididurans]MBL1080277.1 aminotransferase class I/II-fold pyridoxal phosphate-dependent enzyme [Nocardia acididurans]
MSAFGNLSNITNTSYERLGLAAGNVNLSDAYCRISLTDSQASIIERLPQLFAEARRTRLPDLEREFIGRYLQLAGEPQIPDASRCMFSYSASCAITMVASYCAIRGKTVALLEPTYDSIPSILRRERVTLIPIREQDFRTDNIGTAFTETQPDVVWLISPNNPTGWMIDRSCFLTLVEWCTENYCTLVIDAAFRFFRRPSWSLYEILEHSQVSYVVLEDTGKTWPTSGMKVGIAVCSTDMFTEMYRQHDDLLQGVSPFQLRVLSEFADDSLSQGLAGTLQSAIRDSRTILRTELNIEHFRFATSLDSPISVDWVELRTGPDCERFIAAAADQGVQVLPGTNFYWTERDRGRRMIRIALARDPELVATGGRLLSATAQSFHNSATSNQSRTYQR